MRTFVGALIYLLCFTKLILAGFTDVTNEANVGYLQWEPLPGNLESLRITGGAAAGDVNGDGYPDLLVTRLDGTDILFQNNGNGAFTDVSSAAGFNQVLPTNGVALGDIDNDGDLDAYLTTVGNTRHYLYINDGSGHFTEEGLLRDAAIATGQQHLGMSTTFGDYDRDGFLDLHVTEWGNINYEPNELYSHARVLHNLGSSQPGYFEDTTLSTKVFLDEYVGYTPTQSRDGVWTFASTFADMDRDGHADLAIVGDFHTSRLYWNNGDDTFTLAPGPDSRNPAGIGTDENGMGSAIADFNGDGLLDWFVTAIYDPADPCFTNRCHWNSSGNRLYLNNGDRTFTDVTDAAGVRDGGWGWGATFFDYDNDGDLDLAMTNGMVTESEFSIPFVEDPMKLWRNNGDGTFIEVANEEGLTDTAAGKGILNFDYDLDGDLDLFVVNNGDQPKLYRNDHEGNAYLKVELTGTESNRDGIGTYLTLRSDENGQAQTRYLTGGGVNYLSQSDMTVHFGLGDRTDSIHELLVEWPSGKTQVFTDIAVNSTLQIVEQVPEPVASIPSLCLLFLLTVVLGRSNMNYKSKVAG